MVEEAKKNEDFFTKLNDRPVQYILVWWAGIAGAGLIIWPLFDWFLDTVMIHKEFVYDPMEHILRPVIVGLFMAVIFYLLRNVGKKK